MTNDATRTKSPAVDRSGSRLPTSTAARTRSSRGKRFRKIMDNVKITVLCGFVTILVLRGTIGFGDLASVGGAGGGDVDPKVVEDVERVLREIRSETDPDDAQEQSFLSVAANATANPNATAAAVAALAANFSLGPKVSNWDEQRRRWLTEHPEFPNKNEKGKPRVLMVTGSPPGPCDNPVGDHYLLKAIKNKIDYCRLHGMEIVYNMALLEKEFSDYWAKLPLVRKLMLSHPEIEWIWWVDSDAILTDMAFELPLEKYEDKNLIIHGYPDLVFEQHNWVGINMGIFIMRNCQWSLDLLDAWAPMGPKGPIRDAAGKKLTAYLKGRPDFEADDQSALLYLMLTQPEEWGSKIYVENSYYLHGFWQGLVDKYEELMEKHHPGFGDERWPFITHFVGCKPCGKYGDYPIETCLNGMERAFNFADNQILRIYGFAHKKLRSPSLRRIRNQTTMPLEFVDKINLQAKIQTRA